MLTFAELLQAAGLRWQLLGLRLPCSQRRGCGRRFSRGAMQEGMSVSEGIVQYLETLTEVTSLRLVRSTVLAARLLESFRYTAGAREGFKMIELECRIGVALENSRILYKHGSPTRARYSASHSSTMRRGVIVSSFHLSFASRHDRRPRLLPSPLQSDLSFSQCT